MNYETELMVESEFKGLIAENAFLMGELMGVYTRLPDGKERFNQLMKIAKEKYYT